MKIALTYHEGRAVISRMPPWLRAEMTVTRKNAWNRSHLYQLPPVAWKWILDELRATAYGPRGGYKYAPSLYTAIAKIADKVREWELHPAFVEGRGVVGVSGEVVPGFISPTGDRSPYPPGEFVLLAPQHVLNRGRRLTVWRPVDWVSGEDPLCSEGFHTRFFVKMFGLHAEL